MPHHPPASLGLVLFAAIAVPIAVSGCGSSKGAEGQGGGPGGPGGAAAAGPRAALVRVAAAELRPVSPRVFVVGTVVPQRTSIVASGSDGVVIEYDIDDGQYVEPGQVLSVLLMKSTDLEIAGAEATLREREELWKAVQKTHPAAIAEAQAQLQAAETLAEFAARRLDRARTLFEQNALNREALDTALESARSASASREAAQAALERIAGSQEVEQAQARYEAQRDQVDFLKAEKEKRTTRAPFGGYVVQEHTYVGQWLSKGDPIVTLARLDEVDVIVNVDQWDLRHVRIGQPVTVTVRGTAQGEWSGTVMAIVPRSEWQQGSRGFPVRVRLKNEFQTIDGVSIPVLNEGMMAEVTFEGAPVETVLVPKDALVRSTHGMSVYIFVPDAAGGMPRQHARVAGKAHHVPVETGLSDRDWVEVRPLGDPSQLGAALASGVLVVTEGGENLTPPVQPNVEALLK